MLKGWFHGSAHVQAMTQDKSIQLFMDQSEASRLSRAKFARDSLAVKFYRQLVEPLDRFSSRFKSFVKLALDMLSAPAESASCKCNGVCSRKDGQKSKGCPCKTRGEYCSNSCKCLKTAKKCQKCRLANFIVTVS